MDYDSNECQSQQELEERDPESPLEIISQEQPGQGQPQDIQKTKQNNMSLASMVLGIIGIMTSCCCCIGIISGSLGIVFAILSRTEDRFSTYAVVGLITSCISVVLSSIVLVFYYILLGGLAL